MIAFRAVYALLGLLVALPAFPGSAETLTPTETRYEFAVRQDGEAASCDILLTLLHLPSPESVVFRLFFAYGTAQHVAYGGFSADVGDMTFSGGRPADIRKVPLSEATFVSPTFRSTGRLNGGPELDGGILERTGDERVAGELLQAFVSGQFEVSFSRRGSAGIRTYQVADPPPAEVLRQFGECVERVASMPSKGPLPTEPGMANLDGSELEAQTAPNPGRTTEPRPTRVVTAKTDVATMNDSNLSASDPVSARPDIPAKKTTPRTTAAAKIDGRPITPSPLTKPATEPTSDPKLATKEISQPEPASRTVGITTTPWLRPPPRTGSTAEDPPERNASSQAESGRKTDSSLTVPAPAPPTQTVDSSASSKELESLLVKRGDQLLRTGDVVAARLFYERAAAGGSAAAATGMGRTFDPVYLAQIGVRGVRADPVRALTWYRKASEAGDPEAAPRLRALPLEYPILFLERNERQGQ